MSLATRIERLEESMNARPVQLPPMVMRFVDVVHDEDGRPHPGPCTGGVIKEFGKPDQWFDADGNMIPTPERFRRI